MQAANQGKFVRESLMCCSDRIAEALPVNKKARLHISEKRVFEGASFIAAVFAIRLLSFL